MDNTPDTGSTDCRSRQYIRKAVVASDSFKGSLTSAQVAGAVTDGIKCVYPECEVVTIEAADGGEGTTAALMRILGGKNVQVDVHDPLMRPVKASYGILEDCVTAIMEMSAASGLALLGKSERDPMKTTTFGTGEMIADALRKGCRHFLIGIGGSATNDAGTGMLSAMGARFLDKDGNILPGCGESLPRIASIDFSGIPDELRMADFTVACDVDSPFCGPDGAAFVFAPQKGADLQTVKYLDLGLDSFAATTLRITGKDMRKIPGGGAAGGLGGAFSAFLGARLVSGSDLILDAAGFDSLIKDADLVITGEGRIDSQTSRGKLPYRILERSSAAGIPVIAIAGSVAADSNPGFAAIFPTVQGPCTLEQAMNPATASRNISITVARIMRTIQLFIKPR